MKKIFISATVMALIVPQIALASWWNPFSWSVWNVFQKTDTKSQVLEKHISEPQSKSNSVASSTTIVSLSELSKEATTSSSVKQKPTIVDETKLKPVAVQPKQSIQVAEPSTVQATSAPVIFDACKNIEGVQTLAPDGMYADSGNCFSSPDKTIQELQQTVQQIQQNVQQLVQNTVPTPPPVDTTPPTLVRASQRPGFRLFEVTYNEPAKIKSSFLPLVGIIDGVTYISGDQIRINFIQGLYDSRLINIADDNLNTIHEMDASGLVLGASYMVRVEAEDSSGNKITEFLSYLVS